MFMQQCLDQEIKNACPIHGISFGRVDDPQTWIIDFMPKATDEERSLAHDILKNFTWDEKKEMEYSRLEKIHRYRDDLCMKATFVTWTEKNPGKDFGDYIDYLETLQGI